MALSSSALLVLTAFLVPALHAQRPSAPNKITVQGRLAKNGIAFNGSFKAAFALYVSPTAKTPFWSQTGLAVEASGASSPRCSARRRIRSRTGSSSTRTTSA